MALTEKLQVVELNAANEVVVLLDLNDGVHYMMEAGTFEPLPPEPTAVLSEDQRRWGGARQVGEVHATNGSIEWVAGVTATTEQQALEKVETLLAQLAANPYHAYVLWEVPGASHPTLYEMRGTGTWQPKYNVASFEGAQLFLFQVHLPVAPLAQGLPVKVYEGATKPPATITLASIPGDAPAKAEVSLATGAAMEPHFITGAHKPTAVAVNTEHIFWTNEETGYIGRAALNGSSVEETWLNVTGKPYGLAINSEHIFWGNAATNDIGRATLAGGSIEGSFITGCNFPRALAVNSEHIFWSNAGSAHIGRATLAGGSVEQSFMSIAVEAYGLALGATYIYWARKGAVARALLNGTAQEQSFIVTRSPQVEGVAVGPESVYWANSGLGTIGRAALNGTEINETWAAGIPDEVGQLALHPSLIYLYWAGGEFSTTIGRTPAPDPSIWGLIGWAAPTTGLAAQPFGVLDAATAVEVTGWTYEAVGGARGGKALYGYNTQNLVYWDVDPATMVPDSFAGEVGVEVWGRVLVSTVTGGPTFTVSAQPADGPGYGPSRYTDEWGSVGRPVQVGEGNEKWRLTRLGTLHMVVNPLAPRVWRLAVEEEQSEAGSPHYSGLDFLLLVPVTQRACSPSSKPFNSSFPSFIATVGEAVKTVRSNLSAVLGRPGENGFPDSGLGGQLMELPPGSGVQLLIELSNMVPDAPVLSPTNESGESAATVTVWVTPRFFLARTV